MSTPLDTLTSITDPRGQAFKRLTGVKFDSETSNHFSYVYGANGGVAQLKDHVRGTTVTSEYDAANRPQRKTILEGSTHAYTGEVSYDGYNNLQTFKEQVGSGRTAYTTTFTHDNENRPTLLNFGGTRQVAYAYDGLGRVSQRTVNAGGTGVTTTYGYLAGGHGTGSTTPLVQTITQSGTTLTYAYDAAGNITSVSDGSKTTSYEYDLLGQLTRVNDPYDTTAGSTGTTWKYAYDQGGNIQSKTAYAFTTGTVGSAVKTDSYTYGDTNWKDKLTAFNGVGISYDAIGNPTSDGTWSYIWEKGRQLQQISKVGEVVRFVYNEDGLRVQKVAVTTGTTNYTLHGKNIVHMTQGSNYLHFFYDAQDKPAVVLFNGTAYAYLYNLQGDVIALVDSNGTQVVKYTYDAWGKPISKTGTLATTLGTLNPFRYRGYVYDEETGMYYLRSRYYNPTWCRFASPDAHLASCQNHSQHNVYVYCGNEPIGYEDQCGNEAAALVQKSGELGLLATIAGIEPSFIGELFLIVASIIIFNEPVDKASTQVSSVTQTRTTTAPSSTPAPSPTPTPTPAPTISCHQEYFPANPLELQPLGLVPNVYKNGSIIKWTIPMTKIALFEWNVDAVSGPHYHVMLPGMKNQHLEGNHYKPGDPVPEPWNSAFFGAWSGKPWNFLD